MLHLIWYIIVGLIAGVVAKMVMHMHITLLWTIVLGIVGSVVGGSVTHLFSPRRRRAVSSRRDYRFHTWGSACVVSLAQV
jgi:uncharacterized membrane protein YeaQ/YmgE (transglycosylase-associated protein family)